MSFSSGVFTINTSGQPVVTGTDISAPVFNAFTADIATGLSTALLKDGTQTVTANIPMSSFKFTGLGAGTTAGDSLRYEQLVGAAIAPASITFGGSVLSVYVTGTFTPTDGSGASLSLTNNESKYTRTGSGVGIQTYVTYPATASGANASFSGLPVSGSGGSFGTGIIYLAGAVVTSGLARINGTTAAFYTAAGVAITNAQLTSATIGFSAWYAV